MTSIAVLIIISSTKIKDINVNTATKNLLDILLLQDDIWVQFPSTGLFVFFSDNYVSTINKAPASCSWDERIYKLNFYLTAVFATPLLNNAGLLSPLRLTQMLDTVILFFKAQVSIRNVPSGFLYGNRSGSSQTLTLNSCMTFQNLPLSSSLCMPLKGKL